MYPTPEALAAELYDVSVPDWDKEIKHPRTGHVIRRALAWTYEPCTQTATVQSKWEEIGDDHSVIQTWERKPMPLHCVFRFEMEHLLVRTGFEIQAL